MKKLKFELQQLEIFTGTKNVTLVAENLNYQGKNVIFEDKKHTGMLWTTRKRRRAQLIYKFRK